MSTHHLLKSGDFRLVSLSAECLILWAFRHFLHFVLFYQEPSFYQKMVYKMVYVLVCQSLYRRHSQSGDLQIRYCTIRKGIFHFITWNIP